MLAVVATEPTDPGVASELRDLLRETQAKAARLRCKLMAADATSRPSQYHGVMCPRYRQPSASRSISKSLSNTGLIHQRRKSQVPIEPPTKDKKKDRKLVRKTSKSKSKSKSRLASRSKSRQKRQCRQSKALKVKSRARRSMSKNQSLQGSKVRIRDTIEHKVRHKPPTIKEIYQSLSTDQSYDAWKSKDDEDRKRFAEEQRRIEEEKKREESKEQIRTEITALDQKIGNIETEIGEQIKAIQAKLKARLEKKQKQSKDICSDM